MNGNKKARDGFQQPRAVILTGVLLSFALACILMMFAANEPVSATRNVYYDITAIPTDEGGLTGIIVGGTSVIGSPTVILSSATPTNTLTSTSSPTASNTPTKTSTPTATATNTPTPTPTPTNTPTQTPSRTPTSTPPSPS